MDVWQFKGCERRDPCPCLDFLIQKNLGPALPGNLPCRNRFPVPEEDRRTSGFASTFPCGFQVQPDVQSDAGAGLDEDLPNFSPPFPRQISHMGAAVEGQPAAILGQGRTEGHKMNVPLRLPQPIFNVDVAKHE